AERIDPEHAVTMRIRSDVNLFIKKINQILNDNKVKKEWVDKIIKKNEQISDIIDIKMKEESKLTEPVISRLVSENIFPQNGLFLSNSMPIRDMNTFALPNEALRHVGANRGASGIDGIIASAYGFASGLQKTTVLLIGDLAFLHDINSLHLLKNSSVPLIIILLNNKGGGIFRFLPIAEYEEVFNPYFLTPHNLTFHQTAQQFDIPYQLVDQKSAFVDVFTKAQKKNQIMIIEVKTDSEKNHRFHEELKRLVQEKLK
ncbi:2-succinyl-5-enolpyruvyl-6-hydroxy-3-cyclohexene-1-carboxylate synthase, partial [bacterium]|nr:2-succinyl-5-enolpyruvyl-6-hydroxy-3-cyclohexene-1-carboxylate synthase [bacterium]